MTKVRAPGTCGEFIQGIYKGKPSLISSPVDLFSTTEITEGSGKNNLREKGRKALALFVKKFALDPKRLEAVDIHQTSELIEEKGMASSTADIIGLLGALSTYFEIPLSPKQMAEICVAIEPSDNIMYPKLNLFNHYTGEVFEDLNTTLSAPVLIVDFDFAVDTVGFGYETEFKKSGDLYIKALELFKEGLIEKDLVKIGEACSLSAGNNQTALTHPYFKTVAALTQKYKGLGNLIGHSGSVIGVLFDEGFDKEGFTYELNEKLGDHINFIKEQQLIPGGIRVERS